MNAAALKEKLESARQRMIAAERAMEGALRQIELAPRVDKSIASGALSTALAEVKAAQRELLAMEKTVADG